MIYITNAQKKNIRDLAAVISVVAVSMALRLYSRSDSCSVRIGAAAGLLRSSLYIALMAVWGIYIRRRVIQTQVRRYLSAVSALTVLWLALRTAKYFFVTDAAALRMLWYLYYFPMIFIPLLAVFISVSLRKPEDFRISRALAMLYAPAAALFLLVMTNDFHQIVFAFPDVISRAEWSDHERELAAGYYAVLLWCAACGIAAVAIMLRSCRGPRAGRALTLPFVPVFISIAYAFAYSRDIGWLHAAAGDLTVVYCLSFMATFECCIRCGLIYSNIGYDDFFENTSLRTMITDKELNVMMSSGAAPHTRRETLEKAASGVAPVDRDTLLRSHVISSGRVFWYEDVSELNNMIERLRITQDELRDTGNVLLEENRQHARWLRVTEENRLYDIVERETRRQTELLYELIRRIRETESLDEARRLLSMIVVIGTYVKRRSNLIFVSSRDGAVEAGELALCLNESVSSLQLYGASCSVRTEIENDMAPAEAYAIYDVFEAAVEECLGMLTMMLFYSEDCGDRFSVNISLCLDDDDDTDSDADADADADDDTAGNDAGGRAGAEPGNECCNDSGNDRYDRACRCLQRVRERFADDDNVDISFEEDIDGLWYMSVTINKTQKADERADSIKAAHKGA